MSIKKVHVVFKTHLDVGYTDYAYKVISKYFDDFIPKAIELANIMNLRRKNLHSYGQPVLG